MAAGRTSRRTGLTSFIGAMAMAVQNGITGRVGIIGEDRYTRLNPVLGGALRSRTLRLLDSFIKQSHHHCKLTECPPFGLTQTCRAIHILQLSYLVHDCQRMLPTLKIEHLLTVKRAEEFSEDIERYTTAAYAPEEIFFANSETHLKGLAELSAKLSSAASIFADFTVCLQRHEYLPSDGLVLVAFRNLQLVLDAVNAKRKAMERALLKAFDDYPEVTAARLNNLMAKFRNGAQNHFEGKLPYITNTNFSTLGVGRWLDDEIINYFVAKWCRQSNTLGLSTFFAGKLLFADHSCLVARSGKLTADDERAVLRWSGRTLKALEIERWDSVFIPVNENSSHWFSLFIDFRLKHIQICDSLEKTCTTNRKKPISLQKNAQLMLDITEILLVKMLLWLAEVLGRLRGEPVPFQPNTYDCGIHTVWHLQHLLQFREIRTGPEAELLGLAFADDMVGKRWRLAREMLDDCNIHVQDRDLHLQLKSDKAHKKHCSLQTQNLSHCFSTAAEAAVNAVISTSSRSSHAPPRRTAEYPGSKTAAADASGPPQDDSRMDVDLNTESDGDGMDDAKGGLYVSEEDPELLKQIEERKDALFAETLEQVAAIMLEDANTFNFLPDPAVQNTTSVEQEEVVDTPSGATYRRINRWLYEDAEETRCSEGYHPFSSRLEWELAQWAIREKISHSSVDRLLQIPRVKENLDIGFTSARSMLDKIDQIPERCGPWYTKQLAFKDRPSETFTVRHRDPVETIKALWGDPGLSQSLVYKPAKLFSGEGQTEDDRIFSEMWTGSFWNAAQECIPEGGTIALVIIATDKTQLTVLSSNKSAYPVYLTIGNIPKELRRKPGARACVLIAYLSVDKPDDKGLSKTQLKLRNHELFHRSMAIVLGPLKAAGDPKGKGVEMVGGDGAVRRVYPLLATYIADYPEQCLVTCTKSGTCPKCRRKAKELDSPTLAEPRTQAWTLSVIRSAREELKGEGDRKIHTCTMKEDVTGGNYDPFWAGFPVTDIHRCISPDILHQLYLGVFKHLLEWIQDVVGEKELDDRIRALPMTCGVRHFGKGIASMSQVSGTECKHMACVVLACLVGKMHNNGIIAVRSLFHFIQLAQLPSRDQQTLGYMKEELDLWHKHRKFFIDHGPRTDFKIPKFHSLLHFVDSIRWLGTTDNYNTESFERLHIDLAKDGWRASNRRNHFPQMMQWLSRQGKITSYNYYRSWASSVRDGGEEMGEDRDDEQSLDPIPEHEVLVQRPSHQIPTPAAHFTLRLAKSPQEPRKKLTQIVASHLAPLFISELKLFLNSRLPADQQTNKSSVLQSSLPFTGVDVWHQFKFIPVKLLEEANQETVKAVPLNRKSRIQRFDTVLVLDDDEAESTAVKGESLVIWL
ncbi:hypothetical protein D9757_012748 [Collybiopsis confluens]|uniref:Ubiquitin-like protease family profile domain-containing protein n=1 Tax=Collybiopsis confluens TaxID=2823264 RepID=A0A8H5LPN2_9AGAR|nr:hypothetical protein D9757_012748 [Collybiopsis confluens]